MNTYKNPWHKQGTDAYGPAVYTNNAPCILSYRGFSVYRLGVGYDQFDYVYNGVCITQRAGASKAREVIDSIIAGDDIQNMRAHEQFCVALAG